ncbi:MAG: hypothetical protein GY757_60630 [bacterium]|nr:hypothetical protein [bacterium]
MITNSRKTLFVLMLLILFISSQAVSGRNIYVKAGASGDGTKASPYGTLWKALNKALRDDVIHVTQGTYEGKGGSGAFIVKVPNLTLAGGYNDDYSKRDPFKYFTILQRAADYKGDWMGIPEGLIEGKHRTDHSNLIVDGFVLDSKSRNAYKANGDINPRKSWKGTLLHSYSKNITVRNSILLNPYADGIYCMWQGKENEVSNCFILNTFYTAISTRSAQKGAVIKIKNNTIGFIWTQPGKGGGTSLVVGNQGQTIAENNIFMFNQAFAVNNGFGNEDTILKNNIFFLCQGGYYKLMDEDGQNLLLWKSEQMSEMNDDAESYMMLESGGNSDKDPGLKPNKEYFEKFSNFVASKPGKLKMDTLNRWRRSVGLNLQAEPGSARKNWGMAYPLESVVPNLVSSLQGRGARVSGPFKSYNSKTTAAGTGSAGGAAAADYKAVEFDSFKKGAPGLKSLAGTPVVFKAGMGGKKFTWLLKTAPRDDYECVMLIRPNQKEPTRKFAYGYLLKGSEAHKKWQKYYKKKDKYNSAGGLTFKGKAFYAGTDSYSYPAGIVIDEVKRK